MNPRIGAIGLGLVLWIISWYMIPDPNNYHYYPWPHKLFHVYCNHALLWVYADQAEHSCHPGPESRQFMQDLQMLAHYSVYERILNAIPYTYPAIVGLLVVLALPAWVCERKAWPRISRTMQPSGDLILGCTILFIIIVSACYVIFVPGLGN